MSFLPTKSEGQNSFRNVINNNLISLRKARKKPNDQYFHEKLIGIIFKKSSNIHVYGILRAVLKFWGGEIEVPQTVLKSIFLF